jgi:hypothetical protein
VGFPVHFLRNHFKKGSWKVISWLQSLQSCEVWIEELCVCTCTRAGLNTLFNETFSLTAILLVVCVISGSTAKEIRSVFWVIIQWVVAISFQHFRTTYQFHRQGLTIQKEIIAYRFLVCPHCTLVRQLTFHAASPSCGTEILCSPANHLPLLVFPCLLFHIIMFLLSLGRAHGIFTTE